MKFSKKFDEMLRKHRKNFFVRNKNFNSRAFLINFPDNV